jgi:serine/threonine protein kinase
MTAGSSSVGAGPAAAYGGTLDEAYCPACDRSYGVLGENCPHDGTRLIRLGRDAMLNREIDGRFIVRERIGAGGMGVVYRAWQESVRRDVAVKVMKSRTGIDMVVAKRFLREARLASQLAHPSTVSVIDFGQTDDEVLYLVMELLRGKTLAEELVAHDRFGVGRACRIAVQLAEALEAAHSHDIVHRDLKPANVMILDEPAGRDQIKVMDFGLAKAMHDGEEVTLHTMSGNLLGTPTYMAPEMASGGIVDARSDLYAVGVILYEMLAGRPPFESTSLHQLIAMHASETPPPIDGELPPELVTVIGQLLAKDPAQRVQTARELREALEPFAASEVSGRHSTAPGLTTSGTTRPGSSSDRPVPLQLPVMPTAEAPRPGPPSGARLAALRGYTSLRSARKGRAVIGSVIAIGALISVAIAVATSQQAAPASLVPPPASDEVPAPVTLRGTAADVPAPASVVPTIGLPIVSNPRGATVEIDGVERGVTPLTVDVEKGATVQLRVSMKGYRTRTSRLTVTTGVPIEIKLSRSAVTPFVKP